MFASLPRALLVYAVLVLPVSLAAIAQGHAAQFTLSDLSQGRYVMVMRHALAPGTGDPANFQVGDCATQRNLDAAGRAQAAALGARLRAAGITEARVLSSQWCRCLETARLLGLGEVEELTALNSFYQRPEDREKRLAGVRRFLSLLGTRTKRPVILVTHWVTVLGLSGESLPSGHAVVLKLDGTGNPAVAGLIATE